MQTPNKNPVFSNNNNNGNTCLGMQTAAKPCLCSFHDSNKTSAPRCFPCKHYLAFQQCRSVLKNSSQPTSHFLCSPCPFKEKKPNLKKKQKSRKRTSRQWLSIMDCFRNVLKCCICQRLSNNNASRCCLQYCNCSLRAKEVQTTKCLCKECTLHLRKTQIQKQVESKTDPIENTKLKSVKCKIDAGVQVSNDRTSSQQNKSKSIKSRKDPIQSKASNEPSSSTIKKPNDKQNSEKNKSKSVTAYKSTDSKNSNLINKIVVQPKNSTNLDLSRNSLNKRYTVEKFRSTGGHIKFKRFRRQLSYDLRNDEIKTNKNKKLDSLPNPSTSLSSRLNDRTSSNISEKSVLNLCQVKQENENSPAYLEEVTITAYLQCPSQKEDCDLENPHVNEERKKLVKFNETDSKGPLKNLTLPIEEKFIW